MSFEIEEKVALVTGAASGIGLQIVKALLRNGILGVTIVDINKAFGTKVLEEIEKEFGPNRVIFVETDVSNSKSLEDAFKKCISKFNNLDIVINCAGVYNDKEWEKMTAINFNGEAYGTILALENYIPKYRTNKNGEGVILNVASAAGITPINFSPMYCATKFAIVGMSMSFGDVEHYNRTKIKVLTMCPGLTNTPLIPTLSGNTLGKPYEDLAPSFMSKLPPQEPTFVAESVIKIIKHAKSGTVWVAEGNQEPYQFVLPERETFLTNTLQ